MPKTKPPKFSHSQLLEWLSYDPETGSFTRSIRTNSQPVGVKVGCLTSKGYWYIGVGGERKLGQDLAWFYMTGNWPLETVDHIDRDRSNNTWSNLRLASMQQQSFNRGTNRNKTHKAPVGVFKTRHGTWNAKIGLDFVSYDLGSFPTPEEASMAYQSAKQKLHQVEV